MLTVYGNYLSQPSRAVLWALAMKGVPFTAKSVNPMAGGTNTADFLAKFPMGAIPSIEDVDANGAALHLSESNSILVYLAEKHNWDDLYPRDDAARKAKINQWLHWHHGNLRPATTKFFFPLMTAQDKIGAEASVAEKRAAVQQVHKSVAAGKKIMRTTFDVMKYGAFVDGQTGLKKGDFLGGGAASVADIAAYCELDQLFYFGLMTKAEIAAESPEVAAWLERMGTLPEHDSVRRTMVKAVTLWDWAEMQKL
jgi:glutathione S-transferase